MEYGKKDDQYRIYRGGCKTGANSAAPAFIGLYRSAED
ncbi:unknown [Clostridium sp. CAG:277]|nr:unknown [Clostridium sp. CAG:277]